MSASTGSSAVPPRRCTTVSIFFGIGRRFSIRCSVLPVRTEWFGKIADDSAVEVFFLGEDSMSKRVLRSNFEPGTTRESVRRAQWRALGLSDADMQKPKIAVVNSSSELAICFSHLDGVAKVVKEAVRAAGGLPFEIRTAAPSDFIISAGGSGYILASRDLVVNDMEIAIQGAQLDGMICLTSCDKTPPAHLMAAGRFNIPQSSSSADISRAANTAASTSTSKTYFWGPCKRSSASSTARSSWK